jgi:mannosyltransferase
LTHHRFLLAAILVLAALLRAIHANAELWFDEIVTVLNFVRVPLRAVVTTYTVANNHVLNSVLTNMSASVFGEAPWALRLPAVAFGVAGVWAFWWVAARLWPATLALIGTLLFATSYHHIYYSQNARGYSAFLFFALVATGCVLRLSADDARGSAKVTIVYILAVTLGLYSMLLMSFVAGGHAAVLLATRRWRLLVALVIGIAGGMLLYAPLARDLIAYYASHPDQTGHQLLSMAFAGAIAPLLPVLVAGAALVVPVIVRFARRDPYAAALLLAPLAVNVLVPLVRGQGVYPRSFIFGLPIAYLLVVEAWSLLWPRRRALVWIGSALIVAASIVRLVPYYQLPKQGFRQALAFIAVQRQAGERVAGVTLGGKAARFYDPEYVLLEDAVSAARWMTGSPRPAWIVSTFLGEMRSSDAELYEWLRQETQDRAEFPGVIGDGTVHVHYWPLPRAK